MTSLVSSSDAQVLLETAHLLADVARAETLPRFRTALLAENKDTAGYDPVTEADRAAETAMREILAKRRPQDAILGEEMGRSDGESGLTWVLDPIDGTRAFLAGAPTWGTLISVVGPDGPLLGIIDQPWTGERWVGGLGQAHVRSPHGTVPLQTRGGRDLSSAILCSTFPEIGTPDDRAAFQRVDAVTQLTRYGLDCYAYGLLSAGHVDLVIEAGLAAYDICAPIAVIEAGGGVVTNWEGGPVHDGGRALAAANADLHQAALTCLAGGA